MLSEVLCKLKNHQGIKSDSEVISKLSLATLAHFPLQAGGRREKKKRMNNAGDVSESWLHSVIDIRPQHKAVEFASDYFWA